MLLKEETEKNEKEINTSSSSLFQKSLDGLKQIRPPRNSFFSKEESRKIRIPKLKQIANLPRALKTWERIIIFFLCAVILISIGFWIEISYLKHSILIPKNGGQYIEGIVGQPKYLNPILAQTNDIDLDLSSLIFSGLLKYDSKGELVSDLAQEYAISDDQKTYNFTLKNNLRWQDNQSLTTDDIIFTIHKIQDPEFKSPLRSSFSGVDIQKIDDLHFKFILREPYAPFINNLTFGILPSHLWENIPSASAPLAEYNLKPIGSGPWQFYKLKKNKEGKIETYFLRPNPNYYGPKSYLEKINFQFYNSFDELALDLQSKKIDGAGYIPRDKTSQIIANNALKTYSLEVPHIYSLFLNLNNKFLKETYIREALTYATPKQKIIAEALNQNGQIQNSILGLNSDETRLIEYNQNQTREILEKQGWTKGDDGIYAKNKERLSFTLTTSDWPEYVNVASILKNSYKEVGIELITEAYMSTKLQQEYIRPRQFDILFYGEVLMHNPDLYIFWHSSQIKDPGLNLSSFTNQKADQILEDLKKENDPAKRQEDYKSLDKILNQEIPAIPIYSPYYLFILNKKIKGFDNQKIILPFERFLSLPNWYTEEKRQINKP